MARQPNWSISSETSGEPIARATGTARSTPPKARRPFRRRQPGSHGSGHSRKTGTLREAERYARRIQDNKSDRQSGPADRERPNKNDEAVSDFRTEPVGCHATEQCADDASDPESAENQADTG